MGRLQHKSSTVTWREISDPLLQAIRTRALSQLIQHLKNYAVEEKQRKPTWGDEIEYTLIEFDHYGRTAKLQLRSPPLLHNLLNSGPHIGPKWLPEFAQYQIEATPGVPYDGTIRGLLKVQENMNQRRQMLNNHCSKDEAILTISVFPRLCCTDENHTSDERTSIYSLPHQAIFPNNRYTKFISYAKQQPTDTADDMEGTVEAGPIIQTEVFRDVHSGVSQTVNDGGRSRTLREVLRVSSYRTFGGLCCLHTTIQTADLKQAKYMFDQFAALSPLLIALSAGSPVFAGRLMEFDARTALCISTHGGRDGDFIEKRDIPGIRSRCSSIPGYLTDEADVYNDVPFPVYEPAVTALQEGGFPGSLARHMANLMLRRPYVVPAESPPRDGLTTQRKDLSNYEFISTTVWQTVRIKLPDPDENIGWSVEVRPIEVQITDFENAAIAVFVWLLSQTIIFFGLDFYVPISLLDENIDMSWRRNAVHDARFHFRYNSTNNRMLPSDDKRSVQRLTVDAIVNGEVGFSGLVPLIKLYLNEQSDEKDPDVIEQLHKYLDFISKRASGEVLTFAAWVRHYVRRHPNYKFDAVVSEQIQYDLLMKCDRIAKGLESCIELHGDCCRQDDRV